MKYSLLKIKFYNSFFSLQINHYLFFRHDISLVIRCSFQKKKFVIISKPIIAQDKPTIKKKVSQKIETMNTN